MKTEAFEHERSSFVITLVLMTFIFPLWCLLDFWRAPDQALTFLAFRGVVVFTTVASLVIVRRTTRRVLARSVMVLSASAMGVAVAYFVSAVPDDATVVYAVGFSLVFWAPALVLVWPWGFTACLFGGLLVVHLGIWLVTGMRNAGDFLGTYAYLVSAAAVATGLSVLRQRFEQQKAQLQEAQERFIATEKLQALGRLVAQLSHEINNPMNVIENNVGPVLEYLDSLERVLDIARRGGDLEQAWAELEIDFVRGDMRDAINSIHLSATRVRGIHNDLRAFMRGDAALPTEADLNDGVRSTVAMLKRSLAKSTVLVERYGELPKARFHVGQINQVTMNLVTNALDVVGGDGRIEVETALDADRLVLTVTDSGPGLSETARRHLFEPFFTTKDVGKGTGLGLATCYQIVRAHGGTIALDESHTSGARFVVRLPLAPPV